MRNMNNVAFNNRVKKSLSKVCLLTLCIFTSLGGVQASELSDIERALSNPQRSSEELALDKLRSPKQVLEFFQIKPGMNVIDVFAGEGYYTEILSHLVGENGSVAMQNHSLWEAYSKKGSDARVKNNRLSNVYQVMQDVNNTKLKDNHYDAATIILGMHDLYLQSEKSESGDNISAELFLTALYKGVKPGGVVGVIEHDTERGIQPVESAELHRLDSRFIIKIMNDIGFELEAESNMLRNTNDDYNKVVWSEGLRRHTDRAVMRFRKPL